MGSDDSGRVCEVGRGGRMGRRHGAGGARRGQCMVGTQRSGSDMRAGRLCHTHASLVMPRQLCGRVRVATDLSMAILSRDACG